MLFPLVSLVLLCLLFALEKAVNDRCLASFKAVIHVNGIRGKTSTCRLIDAALRQRYRVFTKTTGSQPRVIDTLGRDLPLRRFGPARIAEQAQMLRRARREKAEIVILECMAVKPILQRISQRQIVRSGISVITNVRRDHILEMGDRPESIATSLAETIPDRGILFTADAAFFPFFEAACAKRLSRAVLCTQDAPGQENRSIARAVAASFGLSDSEIDSGLAGVQEDFGINRLYSIHNKKAEPISFLNLFSANDPESSLRLLVQASSDDAPFVFLFNNRWDRPDRAQLFAQDFFPKFPAAQVLVMGASKGLAVRLFRQITPGLRCATIRHWQDAFSMPKDTLLVGLGNIHGPAKRMLESIEAQKGSIGHG